MNSEGKANTSEAGFHLESLLGDYYTAISIIIVYHLFSIQHWLDRVSDMDSDAETVRNSTARGDLARERVRLQCIHIRKLFPWLQIVLLFFAVSILIFMAANVSLCCLTTIPYFYSIAPTAVLWLVFIATTIAIWLKGRNMLRATMAKL